MEGPARDSFRTPRLVMLLACVAALFTLGFALSAQPQQASAGGLLPTVTLPTVGTPTVPSATTAVVTTTTVAPTTTAPEPAASSTAAAPTTMPAAARTPAQVTGARRLKSGAISIPISSVRAPARLRLAVKFVPGVRVASVHAQVVDSRGYVVRGARVNIQGAPAHVLVPAKAKLSAADGRAAFAVRLRKTTRLHTSIALTIRAFDPAAPALANASSRLRLTLRARG